MSRKSMFIYMLFVFCHSSLYAETQQLNYKATFGIFGTVGTLNNTLTKHNGQYSINTTVTLQGMAKLLLGGQTEHYVSKGHLKNGLMISDFYEMTSIKGEKKKIKTYKINHHKKYVTKRYRKYKNGILVKDTTKKLSFYAKDDLQTLYFNLGTALKVKGKKYNFNVVGLEKQEGKVQITVPSKAQQTPYVKDLGSGALLYAKALIHQKNFKKKKGDILLSFAKDKYIEKSVIKDVILYGDAKIERLR